MDWARAVEINRAALTRIVLGLIAMVGLVEGGAAALLPQSLCLAVARVLRPAESAVRRLIVAAARGLTVKPSLSRPMQKGLASAGKGGGGRISFPLFDAPRRYDPTRRRRIPVKVPPRIYSFPVLPLCPLFQPRPVFTPVPDADPHIDAQRLRRRLAAVKLALETLPRQALRLARWRARCDGMPGAALKSPLRAGPPPGRRKKPQHDVDWVLKECHALARDVLKEDSS